ncbi:MAG: hypothetical protein ACK5JF_13430, partial [Oscillospiraceae bacterium]
EEEEREVEAEVQKLIDGVTGNSLMYNGKPLSDEAKELFIDSLRQNVRMVMLLEKEEKNKG